jgi:hypothetical protein
VRRVGDDLRLAIKQPAGNEFETVVDFGVEPNGDEGEREKGRVGEKEIQ